MQQAINRVQPGGMYAGYHDACRGNEIGGPPIMRRVHGGANNRLLAPMPHSAHRVGDQRRISYGERLQSWECRCRLRAARYSWRWATGINHIGSRGYFFGASRWRRTEREQAHGIVTMRPADAWLAVIVISPEIARMPEMKTDAVNEAAAKRSLQLLSWLRRWPSTVAAIVVMASRDFLHSHPLAARAKPQLSVSSLILIFALCLIHRRPCTFIMRRIGIFGRAPCELI